MPDLNFQVDGAEAPPFAAAPLLAFKLRVTNADQQEAIHSVMLRCQIRIEAPRRRYNSQEQERLLDLFGEPERWGQTLRSILWTHANVVIPPFAGSTTVDLPVPCTYDFNVAATKYLYALEAGAAPLLFLFSGTVFYAARDGALQVAQIAWDREATCQRPILVWKQLMDHYYPNSAWIYVRKDVFDRLYRYKIRRGLPTWEQALENLLQAEQEALA